MVGEAADGEAAVAIVTAHAARRRADGHPHAGASTASRPRAGSPPTPALADVKVLVLTTFELDEYVFEALRVGRHRVPAQGHASPSSCVRAVRVVADGDSLLSPSVTRRVIEAFAARPEPTAPALAGARRADRARARDRRARRHGAVQRRDRRPPGHQPRHRPHPRQPGDAQAAGARPRPARRLRVRGRARRPRPRRELTPRGVRPPLVRDRRFGLNSGIAGAGSYARGLRGVRPPLGYGGGRRGRAAWGPTTDRRGGPRMEA